MRLRDVIRRTSPALPPGSADPSPARRFLVVIEGLTPAVARDCEAAIVHNLRHAIAARLGEHRLERHYVDHERIGYRTHVRDGDDAAWLRLRVALLAEAAGLRPDALRTRIGGLVEGHDGAAPDLLRDLPVVALPQPDIKP